MEPITHISQMISNVAIYNATAGKLNMKPELVVFAYKDFNSINRLVFMYIHSKSIFVTTQNHKWYKHYPNYDFSGSYKFNKFVDKIDSNIILNMFQTKVQLSDLEDRLDNAWYVGNECPKVLRDILDKYK